MYRLWYEEFDFKENPFSIRPHDDMDSFVGQKEIIRNVSKDIQRRSIVILTGIYGTGKTTILQGIIKRFEGQRKVIYHNCNAEENAIDFKELIGGSGTFLQRLFGTDKDLILLLDEAHNCRLGDFEAIDRYHKAKVFKSVIFVTADIRKMKIDKKQKDRAKIYKLNPLTVDEAYEMIDKRLQGKKLIPKNLVAGILKLGRQPREFLMNCEDACRFALERDSGIVEEIDIERIKSRKST